MTVETSKMPFGILLIGDELLTGKRVDKHQPTVIELLAERGLELGWSMTVGDDPERLQSVLEWSFAREEAVFSFGGIGATPDDRTRQCAAAAAGVELAVHEQGRAEIEAVFGERAYPHRIRMVEWPVGAELIPNPVNRVPGFSFLRHHFVPGFPDMAWPMVAWVLDRYYNESRREPLREYLVEVLDTPESDLIDILEAVMAAHPDVRLSCLPNASGRRAVELGVRGPHAAAAAAYTDLVAALEQRELPNTAVRPPAGGG